MADPYVIFPGTAGNHVSTDDVNLLDADTAHMYQSRGNWVSQSQAIDLDSAPDSTSPFGGRSLQWTAGVTGASTQVRNNAVGGPVSVSDGPLSFGCWVKCSVDNVRVTFYLDGGGYASNHTVVPGEWTWIEDTQTVSGQTTAYVAVRYGVSDPSGIVAGAPQALAGACLREGTDATFVPSLRIVGDLFEDIESVDMPIVFAADGTPLTVGEGWAGNGYHYRRYDGPDAFAPLVAQFDAGDLV